MWIWIMDSCHVSKIHVVYPIERAQQVMQYSSSHPWMKEDQKNPRPEVNFSTILQPVAPLPWTTMLYTGSVESFPFCIHNLTSITSKVPFLHWSWEVSPLRCQTHLHSCYVRRNLEQNPGHWHWQAQKKGIYFFPSLKVILLLVLSSELHLQNTEGFQKNLQQRIYTFPFSLGKKQTVHFISARQTCNLTPHLTGPFCEHLQEINLFSPEHHSHLRC